MKKNIFTIIIIFIFVFLGLSGCNELDENNGNVEIIGDTDLAQILSYNIITRWKVITGEDIEGNEEFHFEETEGLLKKRPTNSQPVSIKIDGIVKNIAGEKLDRIKIGANFYDKNGSFLDITFGIVYDIDDSYTEEFNMIYYGENIDKFETISFEIRTYLN